MLHFVLAFALQANSATVVGTVRDAATGEPLRAAVVALTDLNRFIGTDSAGIYAFADVPAGPQHVTVHLLGYTQRTLHALVPANGQLVINILLQPEPIPVRGLAVRARIPLRGTTNSRAAPFERSASAAEVRNHPMLAEPDVFQALGGGEIVIMPESPSGVHIRGGTADHTAYTLDGIPVLNPYHAAGLFSAWNPDALLRTRVASAAASPALPDGLAGVVVGESRSHGARLSAQGSITTTQSRATVDGPLGGDAGYLVSVRSSYPDFIAPQDEGSYLLGESADLFGKIEADVLGGTIRVLGYDSGNEIETAAVAQAQADAERNSFEWWSRSLGASYANVKPQRTIELRAWSATSDQQASWKSDVVESAELNATRRDQGALLTVQFHRPHSSSTTGVRAVRRKTSYDVVPGGDTVASRSLHTTTTVLSAFASHARELSGRLALDLAAAVAAAEREVYPGAHAQLRWSATDRMALAASFGRTHQFAQSLRNTESLVSNVFPADLYVSAGAEVPVARADQLLVSVEVRPAAGVRLALQGYQRATSGIVITAARDSLPFATSSLAVGSGRAHGFALEAGVSGTRFGLLVNYGWQRTRLRYDDRSFVPEYAAAHNLEAGVIAFPGATTALKLGVAAAFGRRSTRAVGELEWEACNLLDRGCEFAGAPLTSLDQLGKTTLPWYMRVDFGARKHWHIAVAGRDASVAIFGTLTNILGRKNVLTYAFDPAADQTTAIGMRPLSPLVVGIDWRF